MELVFKGCVSKLIKKKGKINKCTPKGDSYDAYRDGVFTALGWTELWIVSMYKCRLTLSKEKRFRDRFVYVCEI